MTLVLVFLFGVALGVVLSRLLKILLSSKRDDRHPEPPNGTAIDTSVFIDGRIRSLVELGFVSEPMLVPSQVRNELEVFAGSTAQKYSLQRVRAEQALAYIDDNTFLASDLFDDEDADQQVVLQALEQNYAVASLDREVLADASSKGIQVINPDSIFAQLRPVIEIGDEIPVYLYVKRNKSETLGLTDYGEVVRVKGGAELIGKKVRVEIVRLSPLRNRRTIHGRLV